MHFTVYNCPMAQPHRCNHTQTPRPRPLPPEIARHWRAADGIDLFEADYKRFTFPKHSHDYYAFGTILNGAEQFMTGGTNYVARRGQLLMMNPMQVHDGGPACDDGYQYQIMFIAPKVFGNLVDELSPHSTGLPFFGNCVVDDPELHLQLQSLHRMFRPDLNQTATRLERDSQLLYSAARLALRHADAPPYSYRLGAEDKRVKAAIDYMADHLDENISLDELAILTELSRFHLLRVFRQATGLPPQASIIDHPKDRNNLRPGPSSSQALPSSTIRTWFFGLLATFTNSKRLGTQAKFLEQNLRTDMGCI